MLVFLIGCSNYSAINIFNDYDKGVSNASKFNQEILLIFDFAGNPTNFVKRMLYDKDFLDKLQDFTIILLDVDEKEETGCISFCRNRRNTI